MSDKIDRLIEEGYTITNFKREQDLATGDLVGVFEVKALDGYIETIKVDDNGADEVEEILFNYLRRKKDLQ